MLTAGIPQSKINLRYHKKAYIFWNLSDCRISLWGIYKIDRTTELWDYIKFFEYWL